MEKLTLDAFPECVVQAQMPVVILFSGGAACASARQMAADLEAEFGGGVLFYEVVQGEQLALAQAFGLWGDSAFLLYSAGAPVAASPAAAGFTQNAAWLRQHLAEMVK